MLFLNCFTCAIEICDRFSPFKKSKYTLHCYYKCIYKSFNFRNTNSISGRFCANLLAHHFPKDIKFL